jgi:hypothetical protein
MRCPAATSPPGRRCATIVPLADTIGGSPTVLTARESVRSPAPQDSVAVNPTDQPKSCVQSHEFRLMDGRTVVCHAAPTLDTVKLVALACTGMIAFTLRGSLVQCSRSPSGREPVGGQT